MFYDLHVLHFALKHLIWILPGLEHASSTGAGIHLRHLLGHLIGRYLEVSLELEQWEQDYWPLSLPRMNMKTDCSPNRLRKYQERLDTHRTSRSRVATPDCSMDLNLMVNGKGNFTDG